MAESKKVTKSSTIQDVLSMYPKAGEILVEYGFHCVGCAMAQYETLKQGAQAHGLSKNDVDELIEKLNNLKPSKKRTKEQ